MVGEDVCFWPAPNNFEPNLSEDLFFFCSSPNFGRKIGLSSSATMFIQTFVLLTFFEVPGPPFQNPAYATGHSLVISTITN